jgi:riboflavin biosynthesis pyrimidine reductase
VPAPLQRLIPSPTVEIETLGQHYAPLRTRSHERRPHVAVCMVSSLDGSISVAGRSGGLSNPNDAAVLRSLRIHADVVIVGAGTVRDESYGAPVRADQRIGVVTVSGAVDTTGPLFAGGSAFLICPSDTVTPEGVDVLRVASSRDGVDITEAVERLGEMTEVDVHHVLCEGGSRLNGALLDADLVDELNLTVSPLLVGGTGPRLSTAAEENRRRFRLAQLIADDDSMLFGRWARHHDDP